MSDNEESVPEKGKDLNKKEELSANNDTQHDESKKKVELLEHSDNEVECMQVDESLSDEKNANTDGYYATLDSGSEREINALLEDEGKEKHVKDKTVNKVRSKVKTKKTKNVQLSMKNFVTTFESPKKQLKNNKTKGRERNIGTRRTVQGKSGSSSSGSSTDVAADTESEEEEDTSKTSKKSKMGNKAFKNRPLMFKRWSDQDTEQYRKGYPGKKDDTSQSLNLDFYTNKIVSRPDGGKIDDIHKKWWGDYQRLEQHHGYIQWLFPIRENGMNFQAQELQPHEAKAIIDDELAHNRVLKSYKMMLDFYGMKLNEKTFEVERADNWRERFQHLNRSMHNYLRITRILKSLGEFDYEHLKAPFVKFVMKEALEYGTLRNVMNSCLNYWVGTLKNDKERKELMKYAKDYQSDSH